MNGFMNYVPYANAQSAAGAQVVNRSSVASLSFLVWDIIITFDDEVKLIWSRPWNYTKFVYFFVRYIPVMVQISLLFIGSELTPHFHFTPHDCYIWQVYQGVAASTILLLVDTILILRLHALYHGNKLVRRIVAAFFVTEIIGIVVGLSLALPAITYDSICLVNSVPPTLTIYGAGSIIFQAAVFALTAWKFIEAARSGWGDVPLIMLLMRDGTWAFFLLFFTYVGQLALYGLKNPAMAGILYCWLLTALSFSGYRILLNISNLGRMAALPEGGVSTRITDANIQFTTQIFSYAPNATDVFEMSNISSERTLPPSHGSSSTHNYQMTTIDEHIGRPRTRYL
ncbi:hypothetical protein BDQ12DRAFT_672835 [Crucibulum laeve]|uniref:DUF6533 domain-containing protein n=1 Tax=Crucibulum laeve TaxID=68775 RepID=A0A5C3MI59_9AGAR|nr:hypothetical protein BDQ12DRAFT_672835 [Crucibulum laeve]